VELKLDDITCPFCGEEGFDRDGLRIHFFGGMFAKPCAVFNEKDDHD